MKARLVILSLVAVFIFAAAAVSGASSITLDFDSVSLSSGACTDGTVYLASFGVTFTSVSGGAAPAICDTTGSAVTPASSPNVFFGLPAVTNTDESYDLFFSTPLTQLSFTRATVDPVSALPPWDMFAYDAANNLLDSIVEPLRFPGPPAAVFTLDGPGITRVRVDAFNSAHVTFNHPPIDDLVLVTADPTAVPEPASVMLVVSGLAALGVKSRRRARRSREI
jgi:hypothetical protein